MIRNKNIICISSIDWEFNWQGHQEIMSTLARNGNRVLFIENTGIRSVALRDLPRLKRRIINWHRSIKGFRRIADNLYLYSPLVLPFPYSRIARLINRYLFVVPIKRWMKAAGFYEPVIWTFLPTGTALDIINNIDTKAVIYYCIADFYELAGSSRKVQKTENELIRKSDLIFVQGELLAARCRRLNDNVHIFPFGVRIETFDALRLNPAPPPGDIKMIRKPVIGYIGGIHRHIDFGLIKFIAQRHPEWSIVLIGPVQTDISLIRGLPNVFFLDKKEFPDLPKYINEFDVSIIPYVISEYTETVFPTKLNECHAMGKPVVSTDLPEVAKFNLENGNLVLVGRNREEFSASILKAIEEDNPSDRQRRIASARKNSWANRIEEMSDLLEKKLEAGIQGPLNWQEKFLRFYKVTKRKVAVCCAAVLCLYLLLFHTPLIWFIAAPLKITERPQAADCIVVFAAGTGESGKAGQGYEERVGYAIRLYKEGYAGRLLFSSGYKYHFNEPQMMKILAVSLGVPEEAIILEEESKNTFDNVRFSAAIMKKHKWHSALLVSSPYHMRRASLIFRNFDDLEIHYTPIPANLFYDRSRGVKPRHIRGILHEYLAIIYYKLKGYI